MRPMKEPKLNRHIHIILYYIDIHLHTKGKTAGENPISTIQTSTIFFSHQLKTQLPSQHNHNPKRKWEPQKKQNTRKKSFKDQKSTHQLNNHETQKGGPKLSFSKASALQSSITKKLHRQKNLRRERERELQVLVEVMSNLIYTHASAKCFLVVSTSRVKGVGVVSCGGIKDFWYGWVGHLPSAWHRSLSTHAIKLFTCIVCNQLMASCVSLPQCPTLAEEHSTVTWETCTSINTTIQITWLHSSW